MGTESVHVIVSLEKIAPFGYEFKYDNSYPKRSIFIAVA